MLRPVGEIVPLASDPREGIQPPAHHQFCWVDSGTTALALAIRAAVSRNPTPVPRVAMPAYACPDLVSAVRWAGAVPVVVDTLDSTPWLDPAAIASRPRGHFSAVIAPHFLGIPHPLDALASLCKDRDAVLIEDAAQTSLRSSAFHPTADLVVLSFGRGKPIPVGGGALLHTAAWSTEIDAIAARLPWESSSVTRWKLRTAAQNLAMSRLGYSLARSLPGLAVGATRYVPLLHPARTPPAIALIRGSVLQGWAVSATRQQGAIASMVSRSSLVNDLAADLGWDRHSPLLRYPVLASDAAARDRLIDRLHGAKIEATSFYGAPVHKVANIGAMDLDSDLSNAARFADRLVTLPAHSSVTTHDIELMAQCLECR